MLPQKHRLRRRSDFQHVYRSGRTYHSPLFRLHTKTSKQQATRFGIVVPNKLLKAATARNRKKRQIRAVLQRLLPSIRPGHDVIIFAQAPATRVSYAKLSEDLLALFRKAHLL